MSDLKARFEEAVANSKTLSERPDNMTLLKIYSLYKQATEGDNEEAKPGFADIVARAKCTRGRSSRAPATTRRCSSTST